MVLATLWALLASAPVRADLVHVEVDAPLSGDRVLAPLALVEVRGWAGTGLRGQHDVLILLDRSESTFRASGVDIDGDGLLGRNLRPDEAHAVLWTTDFGDTIVSAEILAARRLIEKLDVRSTRMGLISFGGNAHVDAPLGSSREALLAALERIQPEPNPRGTYIYGAIEEALRAFAATPLAAGESRQRQILLLSDGVSTEPSPPSAAQATSVHAARNAARADARISAFALGPAAATRRAQYEEIVHANGGELVVLDTPSDVLEFVPYMSFSRLAQIELRNVTTGEPGRAVRLFPDGSFDGFAPLAPGKNELRITAVSEAGARASATRTLHYEKGLPDPEQLERFKKLLELRALETRLAEQARTKREQILKKQLELKPER